MIYLWILLGWLWLGFTGTVAGIIIDIMYYRCPLLYMHWINYLLGILIGPFSIWFGIKSLYHGVKK